MSLPELPARISYPLRLRTGPREEQYRFNECFYVDMKQRALSPRVSTRLHRHGPHQRSHRSNSMHSVYQLRCHVSTTLHSEDGTFPNIRELEERAVRCSQLHASVLHLPQMDDLSHDTPDRDVQTLSLNSRRVKVSLAPALDLFLLRP